MYSLIFKVTLTAKEQHQKILSLVLPWLCAKSEYRAKPATGAELSFDFNFHDTPHHTVIKTVDLPNLQLEPKRLLIGHQG